MFACHVNVRGWTDGGSDKGHPLLSRASSAGILVNGRGKRDLSRSSAFVDPLEVFYILPRGTLVLLDKLHECGCLVIGKDDACLLLRNVRVATGMLFVVNSVCVSNTTRLEYDEQQ